MGRVHGESQINSELIIIMGVPEAVLSKVGSLPDVASMSKDDLTALCKQLYERSCVALEKSLTRSTWSERGTWRSTTSRWRPVSLTEPSRSWETKRRASRSLKPSISPVPILCRLSVLNIQSVRIYLICKLYTIQYTQFNVSQHE